MVFTRRPRWVSARRQPIGCGTVDEALGDDMCTDDTIFERRRDPDEGIPLLGDEIEVDRAAEERVQRRIDPTPKAKRVRTDSVG